MLDRLALAPPDRLLALIGQFRDDPRPHKVDLGVGVYRDAAGQTAVMSAVKLAEQELHQQQSTKAYLGARGDVDFLDLLSSVVLGPKLERSRLASVQTPGGTGALRLGADLLV